MWIWALVSACFICMVEGVPDEQRIAGGNVAAITSYPFATALLRNEDGAFRHTCGGTIVTANAILSAASCFTDDAPSLWRARVGSTFSDSGGVVHLIRVIRSHPDFDQTSRANDVAVLLVTVPLGLQQGSVETARLAGAVYTLNTNQQVWALGWGDTAEGGVRSSELRDVQFWVVDQTSCQNRYQELAFTVTDSMVCAGWLDVGVRGQCQGDFGGPLLDNGVVVGVHSWAEGCADPWFPSINTRVMPFVAWIVDAATSQ